MCQALPQKYSHYRPILGDGNCGWRGKSSPDNDASISSPPSYRWTADQSLTCHYSCWLCLLRDPTTTARPGPARRGSGTHDIFKQLSHKCWRIRLLDVRRHGGGNNRSTEIPGRFGGNSTSRSGECTAGSI